MDPDCKNKKWKIPDLDTLVTEYLAKLGFHDFPCTWTGYICALFQNDVHIVIIHNDFFNDVCQAGAFFLQVSKGEELQKAVPEAEELFVAERLP